MSNIDILYKNNTFDFMLLLKEPGYYVVEDVAKQQKNHIWVDKPGKPSKRQSLTWSEI